MLEENDNDCVLIKKKEYQNLIRRANEPKDSKIIVEWRASFDSRYKDIGYFVKSSGQVLLSEKIRNQLHYIMRSIQDQIYKRENEIISRAIADERKRFNNMSIWEKIKFNQ